VTAPSPPSSAAPAETSSPPSREELLKLLDRETAIARATGGRLAVLILELRRVDRLQALLRGPAPATTMELVLERLAKALRPELEQMLVTAGLYPKEAKAMVETWRDSWFEEGTRVFYVLPSSAVNTILPLSVTPAPAQVARVFVGRMEVLNAQTAQAVTAAVRRNDSAVLGRYARFLGPITDRFMAAPADGPRVKAATNAALASYVSRTSSCK
jgi:hypothetical protein